ncbi:MAG: hypothetical protein R3B90_22820 [Planctomycetaceae bacterium]
MSKQYPENWDLDSLYPRPETEQFSALLKGVEADLKQLAEDSEALPAFDVAPDTWSAFLTRMAAVQSRYEDLCAFVGCHAADDAGNKTFQRIEGTLSSFDPLWQQALTSVEFGLKELDAQRLETIVEQDSDLKSILFYLQERQRAAGLRLPKGQELLAADLAVDGLQAWSRLYDRLSGGLHHPDGAGRTG